MSVTDIIALITCGATCVYVILVAFTLGYIHRQLAQQKKEHKLQETLVMFEKLQSQEVVKARRYIYENFPETIEGLNNNQLRVHIQKAEIAFITFDMIGYLVDKDHLDVTPILEKCWGLIWRCWQKSKDIIERERKQRGHEDYLDRFESLFRLCEDYRLQKQLSEPKIYPVLRIIT